MNVREDLSEKLGQRDRMLRSLESDIHKLDDTINSLNREIEIKGAEILQIRSDANKELR